MYKLISVLLLCTVLLYVEGKVSLGSLASTQDMAFIDKFCFDSSGTYNNYISSLRVDHCANPMIGGEIDVIVNALPTTTLAFFHDAESTQFPAVYHDSSLTCAQKLAQAAVVVEPTKLSTGKPVLFKVSGVRPRWWWVAALDCTTNSVVVSL